jgi:hypothetical protein
MGKSNAELVQDRRRRLRAAGLRPVQLWLPDTRTPKFAAQAKRAMAVLRELPSEDAALFDAIERTVAEDWRDL